MAPSKDEKRRLLVEMMNMAKVDNKYKCGNCQRLLIDARFATCCSSSICDECPKNAKDECPMCKTEFSKKSDTFIPDTDTRVEIMEFLEERQKYEDNLKPVSLPFILPQIVLDNVRGISPKPALQKITMAKHFDSRVLAWAMQNLSGITHVEIRQYLEAIPEAERQDIINTPVTLSTLSFGVPALFYAIEGGSEQNVRLLHEFGADLDALTTEWDIGVLSYTAMLYRVDFRDTTELFRTLIGLGTNPTQVPKDMWESYLNPVPGPVTKAKTRRCEGLIQIRNALANSLNVTQRYLLHIANDFGTQEARYTQIAKHLGFEKILEVPYSIIGQPFATSELVKTFADYFAWNDDEDCPMSIALVGLSGHGKSELANNLGKLLNCEIYQVNCADAIHPSDIFGPKPPYKGSEISGKLNKFLVDNEDKRCIVFLDEFEKTTREVIESLLVPLDKGHYVCQVTGRRLKPCVKTIWIMAANICSDIIMDFAEKHENLGEKFFAEAPFDDLLEDMSADFGKRLGAPINGRVELIPYLPFTKNEQAVVAHSYLLNYQRKGRAAFSKPNNKIIGDIHIDTSMNEGKLCEMLATGYDVTSGARSLKKVVKNRVTKLISDVDMRKAVPFKREQTVKTSLKRYAVTIGETSTGRRKITAEPSGRTTLPSGRPKAKEQLFTTEQWEVVDEMIGGSGEEICEKCEQAGHSIENCASSKRRRR